MFEFHQLAQLAAMALYVAIISSYTWARFNFFSINSKSSKIASLIYDPAVAVQFALTLYLLVFDQSMSSRALLIATTSYAVALTMFWWSLRTSKKLDFALGENVGNIITNGPFGIVRHPFYFSYMITWITSTILFDSLILLFTLLILAAFYLITAIKEEEAILKTDFSSEYEIYKNEVGMFIPRATQWKKLYFRLFRRRTK